jgi:hypothetical protein
MVLETGYGEIINEPDDKTIKRVALKAFKKKERNFVLVADEAGRCFIQAGAMRDAANESGCRVEYRDSDARQHFAANNVPIETVITMFQQYNRGDKTFRKAVRWGNISRKFNWSSLDQWEPDGKKQMVLIRTKYGWSEPDSYRPYDDFSDGYVQHPCGGCIRYHNYDGPDDHWRYIDRDGCDESALDHLGLHSREEVVAAINDPNRPNLARENLEKLWQYQIELFADSPEALAEIEQEKRDYEAQNAEIVSMLSSVYAEHETKQKKRTKTRQFILITGHGEEICEPDDKTIKRVVLKTFKKKEDNFVLIEEQDGYYIQARPMSESLDERGCRVEYRDTGISKHFAANSVPIEAVIALLQQYNKGDQNFRKAIRWGNISRQFNWASRHGADDDDTHEETKDMI